MTNPSTTIYYVRFGGPTPGVIGKRSELEHAEEEDAEPIVEGARSADEPEESEQEPPVPGRLMSGTYSFKEVSRLFEISESRLRYWDKSGFISPSGYEGRRRCFTFQDLIGVRSAKILLDGGVSLQRARRILQSLREKLPQSTHPLGRLRILSDTKTVIVTDDEHEFEADSGQLLIDFDVKSIQERIVAELPQKGTRSGERTAYEWYLEGCRFDEDESTLALAEEAYHRAIYLDPTLANAYTNLGNLMYRTGSIDDAKVLYQKAIEVDVNQPEAHYNLGFVEFEEGRLEEAEASFSRAVELDTTFADAHFNVAITLFRLGRFERARNHLQEYLSIEPSGPWADIARKRLQEIIL